MNWKLFILALVVVRFAYDMVLSFIKIRSTGNPMPQNVADLYDAQTYTRWKAYRKEHGRLSVIFTVLTFAVNMVLLVLNVYAAFAQLFPDNFFCQLLAVLLLDTLVAIPFNVIQSYIDNMVIEEKYGFNRTTMKTFTIDQIRSILLNLILAVALVTALGGMYMGLGDWVILVFAGAMFLVMLGVIFLYPFFSRLGNKFVPLEDGALKDRLQALLTKHGYQVRAIEVMDGSRRTTRSNAYFTGFGKTKTIVLYDNILNSLTEDEICAVFAHELGHGVHKDVLKSQILSIGNLFIMSLVMWLSVKLVGIHTAFGFDMLNYGFAYIIAGAILSIISPLEEMGINAYMRRCEYRADRMAVEEGYGDQLISGLKKLNTEGFGHLSPSKVQVVLEYNHPPLSERIAAIEKYNKK